MTSCVMIGVVYQLEFPNGKLYIGISTRFQRRMTEHRNVGNSEDGHAVKRAIRKYGWANVKVSILESGIESREVLKEREVHWIREKGSIVGVWGYNLTAGGDAQPMDHPKVRAWHKRRITEAMNREDVREKKCALWQDDGHKGMMHEARLNFESAEKRRLGFARKREEKIRTMSVHEGKELMRKVRAKLTNNATNPGRVATPGQLEDAKAFWQREWDRYESKYWSGKGSMLAYCAPPQASSAQSKGKSEQVYKANGSSATGVPKSRPSCASTEGVSNDSLLAESDGEPWGLG